MDHSSRWNRYEATNAFWQYYSSVVFTTFRSLLDILLFHHHHLVRDHNQLQNIITDSTFIVIVPFFILFLNTRTYWKPALPVLLPSYCSSCCSISNPGCFRRDVLYPPCPLSLSWWVDISGSRPSTLTYTTLSLHSGPIFAAIQNKSHYGCCTMYIHSISM